MCEYMYCVLRSRLLSSHYDINEACNVQLNALTYDVV